MSKAFSDRVPNILLMWLLSAKSVEFLLEHEVAHCKAVVSMSSLSNPHEDDPRHVGAPRADDDSIGHGAAKEQVQHSTQVVQQRDEKERGHSD